MNTNGKHHMTNDTPSNQTLKALSIFMGMIIVGLVAQQCCEALDERNREQIMKPANTLLDKIATEKQQAAIQYRRASDAAWADYQETERIMSMAPFQSEYDRDIAIRTLGAIHARQLGRRYSKYVRTTDSLNNEYRRALARRDSIRNKQRTK